MKNVTWSSRFTKQIDAEVLDFSQSLSIDIVLYDVDIRVTSAHVQMLSSCGHIKAFKPLIITFASDALI